MNAAVIILARMKKIVRKFYKYNALSEETAKTKEELGIHSKMIFKKLITKNIVIPLGQDKYYLDMVREKEHFGIIRKRMLILFMIVILISIFFIF